MGSLHLYLDRVSQWRQNTWRNLATSNYLVLFGGTCLFARSNKVTVLFFDMELESLSWFNKFFTVIAKLPIAHLLVDSDLHCFAWKWPISTVNLALSRSSKKTCFCNGLRCEIKITSIVLSAIFPLTAEVREFQIRILPVAKKFQEHEEKLQMFPNCIVRKRFSFL